MARIRYKTPEGVVGVWETSNGQAGFTRAEHEAYLRHWHPTYEFLGSDLEEPAGGPSVTVGAEADAAAQAPTPGE